ncbi:HAMP domain-containing sensor histidine kinase [Prosthecobacter sp.]|uniref:sensor histidine kinase n=1 Tax=Prosthecobacter sp. TaxID=1965333 RepID=UPI001D6D0E62|nr:HAMP domain-containing sensor histidine kinase [Prosthecobacter sp.]MCB1277968.1 HAMP domain-containing histidine kinase [Prosthecobacter sp.]
MLHRRSTVLFIILVILPLALLAWLGTYLVRDAEKRTDASMQAILAERLSSADQHLLHDMRQLTDRLDSWGGQSVGSARLMAQRLAAHPWVAEAWSTQSPSKPVETFEGKAVYQPGQGFSSKERVGAILDSTQNPERIPQFISAQEDGGPPFQRIYIPGSFLSPRQMTSEWMTYLKMSGYHIDDQPAQSGTLQSWSGWHVGDSIFIYWHRFADGSLSCALMNPQKLMNALYQRLPPPGLAIPPGRMMLTTVKGIPLHEWGKKLPGSEDPPAAHRACSEPLSQWEMAYTPADEEFPKPYLFPILLGVSSGIVLVFVVGWLYFHESASEIRVAQQRVTFVNQISHELKTPLTNIRLYAEMAAHRAESQGDSIAKRQLGVVEAETARLDRLIQNVLNYARQQRDKLTIQTKPIALDENVSRIVDFWKPLLENKGFEIVSSFHGPATVMADPDAIEQILGNLISNVDKYGNAGKWIAIRTEHDAQSTRVIVEDRGPGIPSGKRRTIFEPFERLRSDLAEGVSGTGIGLTISRELAQLHGGSLAVCPNYRDGARFILTLPNQP